MTYEEAEEMVIERYGEWADTDPDWWHDVIEALMENGGWWG